MRKLWVVIILVRFIHGGLVYPEARSGVIRTLVGNVQRVEAGLHIFRQGGVFQRVDALFNNN